MDATLIEQVLINLLENASVHSESTEEIDLIITQTKECVSFSVRDYGKGIDPEQLPYIFEGQRSSGKIQTTIKESESVCQSVRRS